MNIRSTSLKLKNIYRKNIPEVKAYFQGSYPSFIFDSTSEVIDEIPVFTFHAVAPEVFEQRLKYLKENHYQTLKAAEFLEIILANKPIPRRSVLLTFDDGWGSLWTFAYPLLKKYGMYATCFLIPGLIQSSSRNYHNLEDVWSGQVDHDLLIQRERSSEPYCTWEEISIMYQSGVFDFQSHTLYHSQVHTSSKIIDFLNPSFDYAIGNHNVPIVKSNGHERWDRQLEFGTPIYEYSPRMGGKKRYVDDENLRLHCTTFVRNSGGKDFFLQKNWRKSLYKVVKDFKNQHDNQGHYETTEDLEKEIFNDLLSSKQLIQEKLPNNEVDQLCYPYYVGSPLAVKLSKEAGYKCSYWGFIDGKPTNRVGDDPHQIVRLNDDFIFLLPGHKCKKFHQLFVDKFRTRFIKH
ncbi:polysaccharide deacetylase family protein [Acaryochloris sp. CCMEE 5410]|uniref:polysaccharide deacetylase family protein n=1 Tax=Acaryochloris sp. CCMEE 5410 TaxID=310037 RepID=UPI0002484C5D|nr:polysaccharide deacetylase family protein [Acaryochloris sp. CCMEE 5410]KAI9134458.1 polysaccharide deacetylase family protein [Acaryochloris sp. CCMEE 5410]